MMDIAITIKKGAPKNYTELKYALRSIEKNFHLLGDGDCYLLGEEAPDWFSGPLFNVAQPKGYSEISGVQFKLKAFTANYAGDEFCFSNDDIFILKQWAGTRYFNKHRNSQSGFHNVTVSRAKFLLEQSTAHMVHDYELHIPIIYSTTALRWVFSAFDISIPTALRTLYSNLYPDDTAGMLDCKVMNFMKPDMKWKFFSSDDSWAARRDFLDWLQATWPTPSRWEKR